MAMVKIFTYEYQITVNNAMVGRKIREIPQTVIEDQVNAFVNHLPGSRPRHSIQWLQSSTDYMTTITAVITY